MLNRSFVLIILLSLTSCGIFQKKNPPPKREFRAVWIASVVNIDWPKSGTDNIEKQKADFIAILEFYKDLNFNAVIVQIRTAGDAFYPTELAPWSRYLTGKEGQKPQAYYDPVAWMIEESHNRGFEFHAWLNPYRATFDLDTTKLSPEHDYFRHPEWMIKYGEKYYYNPGLPEVQDHLISIMNEIVDNYEVDAIHFDDYFYPYKIEGENFEDRNAFREYGLPTQNLGDWRRANVDSLVSGIHRTIKKSKPWVHFGISPFGVWRNKSKDPDGSATQASQTTFDDLYANPISWMENGWIDYIVPQLYWSMDYERASHKTLVEWWSQNSANTNLYIGNGAYKIRNNPDKAWDDKNELVQQIELARQTKNVKGNVFFSAKTLQFNHSDVVKLLKEEIYKYPALTPFSPFSTSENEVQPQLISFAGNKNKIKLEVEVESPDSADFILVYTAKNKSRLQKREIQHLAGKFRISNNQPLELLLDSTKQPFEIIALSSLDKYGKESNLKFYRLNLSTFTFKEIVSEDE